MGMLVLLLIAPSLTVALNLPCNVLDGNPFFQEKARYTYMELPLIYDYARYMDSSVPSLLLELATDNWREICLTTFETASSSYCSGVRCSLCAPAVLAAGQGCTKATGKATKDCIRGVFGEGGNCNSCIGEFTNPLSRFINTMSSFDF